MDFFGPDIIAAIAAIFSAIAALLSVWATLKGPQAAAALAEKLRQINKSDDERRQVKLDVFGKLMMNRSNIASKASVEALNLIDVAFNNNLKVREAWADLHRAFDNETPKQTQDDKLRTLLMEMARDLGFSNALRMDDLNRIYYPSELHLEDTRQSLERAHIVSTLSQYSRSPTANTASSTASVASNPPAPATGLLPVAPKKYKVEE